MEGEGKRRGAFPFLSSQSSLLKFSLALIFTRQKSEKCFEGPENQRKRLLRRLVTRWRNLYAITITKLEMILIEE